MTIRQATAPGETPAEVFARWLEDGETLIAVFENQDLGHRDLGRRVARAYEASDIGKLEVGVTRAQDHHDTIGFGWRYILVGTTRTVEGALELLTPLLRVWPTTEGVQ